MFSTKLDQKKMPFEKQGYNRLIQLDQVQINLFNSSVEIVFNSSVKIAKKMVNKVHRCAKSSDSPTSRKMVHIQVLHLLGFM